MTSVVELVSFERKCNEDVVAIVEAILTRAKAGEIVSIGFAGVCMDGAITTGYSKAPAIGPQLGAIEMLRHRFSAANA